MKKFLTALCLLLALILCVCGCTRKEVASLVTPTPDELYYDIERIKIDLSTSSCKDLYDPAPFEELQADVLAGNVSRIDCIYRIQSILSSYNIIHLSLSPESLDPEYYDGVLPFIFNCYGNEYFVNYVDAWHVRLLGWKLVEIGGVSPKQAAERLAAFESYETPTGAKYVLANHLNKSTLKQAGLLDKRGRCHLILENEEGKQKSVVCKLKKPEKISFVQAQVTNLNYRIDAGCPSYYLTRSPENRTVYVHFTEVRANADFSVWSFIDCLLAELEAGSYDTIVWDVRNNPGGEIDFIDNLRKALWDNQETFRQYNLAVAINGRTYSAATMFLDRYLSLFPEAVLFGEETGQAVFNYTAVRPYLLQKLNCTFVYPAQTDESPVLKTKTTDVHRGTMPDVEVMESFPVFRSGGDTVYKAIDAYFHDIL